MISSIDLGPFQEIVSVNFPTGFKPVPAPVPPGIGLKYGWCFEFDTNINLLLNPPKITADVPRSKFDLANGVHGSNYQYGGDYIYNDLTFQNGILSWEQTGTIVGELTATPIFIPDFPALEAVGYQSTIIWGDTCQIGEEVTLSIENIPPPGPYGLYSGMSVGVGLGFTSKRFVWVPGQVPSDPFPFLRLKKTEEGWHLTPLNVPGYVETEETTRYAAIVGVLRSAEGSFGGLVAQNPDWDWLYVGNFEIGDLLGSIEQYWKITFTSETTFELFAVGWTINGIEYKGGNWSKPVKKGNIFTVFKPMNKKENAPYFTIEPSMWGGTWRKNEYLMFFTHGHSHWDL